MKATEIQPGDTFHDVYVVESVIQTGATVTAAVRYSDGGTGHRVFDLDKELPLTHP